MAKNKKVDQLEQHVTELTADLQRVRADFENYLKRAQLEKNQATIAGKTAAILQLLPVIDNIERAIIHVPADLKDNPWAKSVTGLVKSLEKSLESLDLHRIEASPGTLFNPELHEAISMEDGEGNCEIIAEELQPGYKLASRVIRPAMVKVTNS